MSSNEPTHVSQVVFYRRTPYGVRIVRVLHERQLPELHSFEDDADDQEYVHLPSGSFAEARFHYA